MTLQGWQTAARSYTSRATLVVFLIAAATLFILMDRTLNIFDEGLVLTNAMRTLTGDVIHRDYYSPYGPASYYFLSAGFSVFGNNFIVARIFGIAVMAGIVAAVFSLLIARTRLLVCLIFTALVGGWMLATPYYLYPLFPCLLLALVGSSLVLHGQAARDRRRLVLAGCCTGGAALFRYDGGFFVLLVHLTGIAIFIAGDAACERRVRRFGGAMIFYCCGTALIFLPGAIAYLATGSLTGFIADIIDYPLHHYRAMRGLPWPGLATIIRQPAQAGVYLPVVAVLLAGFHLVILKQRQRATADPEVYDTEYVFLVLFMLLTAGLYYKGIVRVSTLHMLMSIIPGTLLLALVFDRLWRTGFRRVGAIIVLACAAIPPAVAFRHELRLDIRDPNRTVIGWIARGRLSAPTAIPETECLVSQATRLSRTSYDYALVANYLRRFTGPDERIFVGLSRHDKIFANPVGVYFLAQRLPGTHWHQFDPGLQTRSDIQRKMVADLAGNHVHWIVRDASFAEVSEPNESSRSSGVHVLDTFIDANFRPVARAGKVEIWLLNSMAQPRITIGYTCLPMPVLPPKN